MNLGVAGGLDSEEQADDVSRVLIFANPFSGRRDNRKLVGRFESALQQHGLEPSVVWGAEARPAALQDLDGGVRAVVAAGGDGSIADVINGMEAAGRLGVPFATLPIGTENLFAKEFGYRLKQLDRIAEAIARGQTRAIDLGKIESAVPGEKGRLFTLMASAGFDAEVVRRVDAWRVSPGEGQLRRVRKASYVLPVLKAIGAYRYPRVRVEADGQLPVVGTQAYVFNLPQYGGGLGVGRFAQADNEKLYWVVFSRPGLVRLLWYHLRCKLGRQKTTHGIVQGYASKVIFAAEPDAGQGGAVPLQADGDPAGVLSRTFSVLPGSLNVVQV